MTDWAVPSLTVAGTLGGVIVTAFAANRAAARQERSAAADRTHQIELARLQQQHEEAVRRAERHASIEDQRRRDCARVLSLAAIVMGNAQLLVALAGSGEDERIEATLSDVERGQVEMADSVAAVRLWGSRGLRNALDDVLDIVAEVTDGTSRRPPHFDTEKIDEWMVAREGFVDAAQREVNPE
jgi:hypothetical protein